MSRALVHVAAIVVALHGLVHLMGFVAYWPLATIADLPYKTDLAAGRWQVGPAGMRIFSLLWLLASLGFLASAFALWAGHSWWRGAMLITTFISTVLIGLDWSAAFRGAMVNAIIAAYLILSYVIPGLTPRP